MVDAALVHPSTELSRLSERQSRSREQLDALLDSTVLATVAFVRDGHPVALPDVDFWRRPTSTSASSAAELSMGPFFMSHTQNQKVPLFWTKTY